MSSTVFMSNGSALYRNHQVAIARDLLFGLSVWNGEVWVPMTSLDRDDAKIVIGLVDGDPLFLWWDEINTFVAA